VRGFTQEGQIQAPGGSRLSLTVRIPCLLYFGKVPEAVQAKVHPVARGPASPDHLALCKVSRPVKMWGRRQGGPEFHQNLVDSRRTLTMAVARVLLADTGK
jgi:hypothetical protein